jgi:hypothetical protein
MQALRVLLPAGSGNHEDRVGQQLEQQRHHACNTLKRLMILISTQ